MGYTEVGWQVFLLGGGWGVEEENLCPCYFSPPALNAAVLGRNGLEPQQPCHGYKGKRENQGDANRMCYHQ